MSKLKRQTCTKMNIKLPLHIAIPFYLVIAICSLLGVVFYSIVIVFALLAFYYKIIKAITLESKKILLKKRIK